ncbi:hypothetical protein FCM35_KLT16652 [Carex littledalei]|uniref:Uncharacterized protein n=1 Tax=Carex littledalei TaxID=544730 RepID=A0A833RHI4_9POAL|nr:hypothetical protein FCM35_KLT16652 [Carex littledalei]
MTSLGDEVTCNCCVLHGLMWRNKRHNRVKTCRFSNAGFEVVKLRDVAFVNKSVLADHTINFICGFLKNIGVVHHLCKNTFYRMRRIIDTGKEEFLSKRSISC